MKILLIAPSWISPLFDSMTRSFEDSGNEVCKISYQGEASIIKWFKLHNIVQVGKYIKDKSVLDFNRRIYKKSSEFKPDLFIAINEASILPDTVSLIKRKGCQTINFVSDNPFDPLRFSYFPITLKHYNILFVYERIWIPSIRNVAPKSKIIKLISGGAFNPNLFYPLNESEITSEERIQFSCDISFTGESYGMRGEAGYRSDIIDQLGQYNVQVWGDERWKMRFPYYKNIKSFYKGERLPYADLRKVYKLSTINLNIPSPQIFTGFQPRTFEIAACKGFQIVDWREELDEWFKEDELVTFKNIPDLIEKIDFFLKYPDRRKDFVEKLYNKVTTMHTWDKRVREIMDTIKILA